MHRTPATSNASGFVPQFAVPVPVPVAGGRGGAVRRDAARSPPRLLAVGQVRLPAGAQIDAAVGEAEAGHHLKRLAALGLHFDLVLVGPRLEGACDAWEFVTRLRTARPWQQWALVAAVGQVTPRAERHALRLGAVGVFDGERDFGRLLEVADVARDRRQL